MNLFNQIFTVIISTIGITGILGYLGKLIIDKSFDLGIERYKGNLSRELETHKSELIKETESYRANLQIIGLEHQIRYSKLHEDRGIAIKEIYSLLVKLKNKLEYFTTVFQGPDWTSDIDREKAAIEAQNNLFKFFQTNRLFFSDKICSQLDHIIQLSWGIIVDMNVAKIEATEALSGPERADAKRKWQEANSKVTSEMNTAMRALEKEFKALIGVD